jgi:chromosome segregation ATPase
MSKVSLAEELTEWFMIAAGMADTEALDKPDLQALRGQLQTMTEAVQALAAEQADLEGRRRWITQQLRITRRSGQDLTIRIKAAIRSVLGHDNPLLTLFNIRPISPDAPGSGN